MRTILGVSVPDSVVAVQLRANLTKRGRPRTICTVDVDDGISQQELADVISADRAFWSWISAQLSCGRLTGPNQTESCVSIRISAAFLNQDGNAAVIDQSTGQTVHVFDDPWELSKATTEKSDQTALVGVVDKLSVLLAESNKAIVDVHRLLPDVMARMLRDVSEQGRASTVTATEQASKLLTAMVEPLKVQLQLIERHNANETERANKSTDAVIRSLAADSETVKDPRGDEEKLLDTMERGWRFIKTVTG